MHIEKAVDVVDLVQAPELLSITQDDVALLEDCKYLETYASVTALIEQTAKKWMNVRTY